MTITSERHGNQHVLDVNNFLTEFGQKCVEFGYYFDQYMRREVDLGEITRRLSEATADAEYFYSQNGAIMTPEQSQRYQVMQITLDSMTTSLIETEIKRNRDVIEAALKNGEYFIVNITYNSISSSIYMIYSNPNSKQSQDRDQQVAVVKQEQEVTAGLIRVLKAIEARIKPDEINDIEYKKLQKAFEIYVEYFKQVAQNSTKAACDMRATLLLEEHVLFLQGRGFYGGRQQAYAHVCMCAEYLSRLQDPAIDEKLEEIKDVVRPPDPTSTLRRLYQEVINAEGEANVYSAVVAFNNFAEEHPNEPKIGEFKRNIRKSLLDRGYM